MNSASLYRRGYLDRKPHFWRCGCFFLSKLPKLKQTKITLKKWEDHGIPANWVNWAKFSLITPEGTKSMSSQHHKKYHVLPNMSQARKRWSAVSEQPHPPTHVILLCWRTPRCKRFILVGILLRSKRQAKTYIFKGTSLCHTLRMQPLSKTSSDAVRKWYVPRTE